MDPRSEFDDILRRYARLVAPVGIFMAILFTIASISVALQSPLAGVIGVVIGAFVIAAIVARWRRYP